MPKIEIASDFTLTENKIKAEIERYKDKFSASDKCAYEEIARILNDFYMDETVNNREAAVRGSDFCEILGLIHDLAEASHAQQDA